MTRGWRSSARWTVGWLVAAVLLATGCGDRLARAPGRVIQPGPGYAYTAALMSAHPLYDALARLELASERLGDEEVTLAAGLMGSPLEPVTLIETLGYGPDLDSLVLRHEWWAEQYNRQYGLAEALPRDLWAGLEWERDDAHRQVEQRMLQAESELTRRVARLRARLVREQQERLNNLALDLSRHESDVQRAAELERDRIWRSIETQLELARKAGERELADLRRELEAQAAERLARAREEAEETARVRREQMAEAGAELRDEMTGEIETGRVATLVAQSIEADPTAANRRLTAGEQSWEQAQAARAQLLQEQRRELLAAQARLRNRLKQDTELWAMVVAHRHNVQLQLLPGGRAEGRDVTASLAAELAQVWRSGRNRGGTASG